MLKRVLFFAYGTFSYLIFFGTFLYAIGFIGGFVVPTTLDGPATAPLAAGIAVGAFREASDMGPVTFDAVTLKAPEPTWWHSADFEPQSGRLVLKNFSILQLIKSAYPYAIVNDQTAGLDRARYDIEVLWRTEGGTSERHLYRALLKQIIQSNSNLEVHVRDLHRSRSESAAQRP